MKNLGAWLIIALGCVLTVGDLGEGGASVGVMAQCGGNLPIGAVPICPTGDITVVKSVAGDGVPPVGGWTLTLGSPNCPASLVGQPVLNIPAAGGVGTWTGLYVSTDTTDVTPCQYTVTEAPVVGWTPSFVPPGPIYGVADGQVLTIALTNTSPTTTTTTIAATTTTTIAPTTTTIAPTTTVAATTTTTTIAPTMPVGSPLPETGSRSWRPTTYVGLVLILLGTLILINRRRGNTASH